MHICKTPEANNKNNLEKQDVEKIPPQNTLAT